MLFDGCGISMAMGNWPTGDADFLACYELDRPSQQYAISIRNRGCPQRMADVAQTILGEFVLVENAHFLCCVLSHLDVDCDRSA